MKMKVSPPDSASMLRSFRFPIVSGETRIETYYRTEMMELQRWNHNYWEEHNTLFKQEKAKHIKNQLEMLRKDGIIKDSLSNDELSLFYKQFLDTHKQKHMNYNWEWYRRHISLILPAAKAFIVSKMRNLRNFPIK